VDIQIVGRHIELSPDLEKYAREKAEKVAKFLRQDVRVEVLIEKVHDLHEVEMIVSGYRGPVIVSHVHKEEPRAAIDLAIDKVEEQLRRMKGRRKSHKGENKANAVTLTGDVMDEPEVTYDEVIDEELSK
jgi:ribosomal subunit interface protein